MKFEREKSEREIKSSKYYSKYKWNWDSLCVFPEYRIAYKMCKIVDMCRECGIFCLYFSIWKLHSLPFHKAFTLFSHHSISMSCNHKHSPIFTVKMLSFEWTVFFFFFFFCWVARSCECMFRKSNQFFLINENSFIGYIVVGQSENHSLHSCSNKCVCVCKCIMCVYIATNV